ncbi:MAG TPA: VWA domain-containing protein [Acidobacteriota bacterium]|nr:VWA domain-containing protein [Acidobacteriota bacterium]
MRKLPSKVAWALLIILLLLEGGILGFMSTTEGIQLGYAYGQYRQQQNEEITQPDFKIKVNVALVTTDVTVIGTAVSNLQMDDFIVYDNGVRQEVSHFSRDPFPLAVAFLIDGSDSIRPYLPETQIAALSALRRLQPEDQVALFSFDGNPTKLSDLTMDRFMIGKKINRLTAGGSTTNIFDSIYHVARYLAKNARNRRRAIILVSDNCQTISAGHGANAARAEMLKASATLYGIKTPGINLVEPSDQVKWIASETGGEILDVSNPTSLPIALEAAMSNLRNQYTLGFYPSNPGENRSFHKLTVKIAADDRCSGCRLLARSGYYYAGVTAPLLPRNDQPITSRDSTEMTDQTLVQRRIFIAGTTDLDLTDIPFTVKTSEQTDSKGNPQLKVDLQINLAGTRLRAVGDKRVCKLHIAVFYSSAKGGILGSDWRMIDGLLSDEKYKRIMKTGILFSTTIPIKERKQILKVVVYDEENDKVGSRLVSVP